MSGNPIGVWKARYSSCWYWQHPNCDLLPSFDVEWTAGKAADAGREHMRRFHYDKEAVVSAALDDWAADHPETDSGGYSRRCGVSLAACEAQTCRCVSVDPGSEKGPENAVQRSDLSHDCATCGMSSADCDRHVFGCCSACNATGGCTHDNPLQTAHNQSREDC